MRTVAHLPILVCLALAGGCAGAKTPPPGEGASMSLTGPAPTVTRFSGRFSPVSNLASGAIATGSTRIVGTVRLLSAPGRNDEFTVEFEFTSDRGAEELQWSVVAGRCGSGSFPLTPPNQLRPIEVPTNGSVRTSRQIHNALTEELDYHVNLYANGGSDLASVIGCANLKN